MTPLGFWQPRSGSRTFGPPLPWDQALRALHLARRAMGGDWRLEPTRHPKKPS